ncbi:MAG: hypothetical protein AABX19_01870 [Nanoarchaeota archaeon]
MTEITRKEDRIEMRLTGIFGVLDSSKAGRLVILDKEPDRVYRYNGRLTPDDVLIMNNGIWQRYINNYQFEDVDFDDMPGFKMQLDRFYNTNKRE